MVYDPFGGSCVTGEVADRLKRKWICSEIVAEYLYGALGRFQQDSASAERQAKLIRAENEESNYYRLPHPGILWNGEHDEGLPKDGGKTRPESRKEIVPIDGSHLDSVAGASMESALQNRRTA